MERPPPSLWISLRHNCLPKQDLTPCIFRSSLLQRTSREETAIKNFKHLQGHRADRHETLFWSYVHKEFSWDFDTEHFLWV